MAKRLFTLIMIGWSAICIASVSSLIILNLPYNEPPFSADISYSEPKVPQGYWDDLDLFPDFDKRLAEYKKDHPLSPDISNAANFLRSQTPSWFQWPYTSYIWTAGAWTCIIRNKTPRAITHIRLTVPDSKWWCPVWHNMAAGVVTKTGPISLGTLGVGDSITVLVWTLSQPNEAIANQVSVTSDTGTAQCNIQAPVQDSITAQVAVWRAAIWIILGVTFFLSLVWCFVSFRSYSR